MKKLCLAIGVAALLAAPAVQAAYDGSISISASRPVGYGTGPGGAFEVTVNLGLAQVIGSPFMSFCLEKNEFISLPGTYFANLNTGAVNGGSGGPNPDPISEATAYLYSQFRSGSLIGYTYGSDASANALQDAIWMLEQEQTYNSLNPFVALAKTTLGLDDTTVISTDANGAYGARVMNLYDAQDGLHQDMLAIVPVPEPTTMIAGALLLLPFGASAMRILRKKA